MGKKKEAYLKSSRAYKGFHYKELPPEMLGYLQKRTLEMLREVAAILDRNSIRYMACGGTLLGAVTTEGATLQCGRTEKNYYLDWVKVRDKASHVYPDIPCYKENGVWVDIYKLVPCRARWLGYQVAKRNLSYVRRRYKKGGLTGAEYRERVKGKKLKAAVFSGWLEGLCGRDNGEMYIIWSASKVAVRKEWVEPLRKVRFEGMELTTFHDADAYLGQHYGRGFRELPPDGMRRVGINRVEVKNPRGGADRLIVICVKQTGCMPHASLAEKRCA